MSTDWIGKWSVYSPTKLALEELDTNKSINYYDLNKRANDVAFFLLNVLKLNKGDRVGLLSEFNINTFVLFSAIQKTGLILVPLNYRLTTKELDFIIDDSNLSILIYDNKFNQQAFHLDVNHFEFESLIAKTLEYSGSNILVEVTIEDPIFILYTSGTTGFPKGAIYTHKMMLWNSINTMLRLQLNGNDSTLLCTPTFHTGGWNVLATPLLFVGGTIYIMPKFEADVALDCLMEKEINLFMTVPTMTKMLVEQEKFRTSSFPKLRFYIVGGEALPISLIETWAEKNVPIRQGYGLTEAGPNITSLPEADALRKRGSIGFFNFYVDHKLMNEQLEECTGDESGELWLKGDVVTPGYWNNPSATEKAFSDGWFKTGDVLRKDDEGYLYIVDRIKNMFISGGENVYPAEIERELRDHPLINEIGVIGVKDEKWGEVGTAYYTSVSGEKLDREELVNFCLARLAKYKIPKYFVHINDMPKTDTGKLDKVALKKIGEQV